MERGNEVGLVLLVMGVLIFLERAGSSYGLREGWPWLVVSLGLGGIFRERRHIPGWLTLILGVLILGGKYYSIHLSLPVLVKIYFLPVLLVSLGLLWLLKFRNY